MNGTQIENLLSLIDSNIDASMQDLHPKIVAYLQEHFDEVVRQIEEQGYAEIQTSLGPVTISKKDVEAAA